MSAESRRLVIGPGSSVDYAYLIVEAASKGARRLRLYAVGENICKLVDAISALPDLYPGRVSVVGWNIGSRKIKGERKSFLELEIVLEEPA